MRPEDEPGGQLSCSMDRRGRLLLRLPWCGLPDDAIEPATSTFAAGPAPRRLPGRRGTLFVPSGADGFNGRGGGRRADPVRSRVLALGGASPPVPQTVRPVCVRGRVG